ncbi:phage integrase central domain-containing protein [Asticcacaulis excentricus]
MGSLPIGDIEPLEVLAVLKKIEKQGNHETAKRTRVLPPRKAS